MKNIRIFYSENVHFLVVKFSVYLNRRVFVMVCILGLHDQLIDDPKVDFLSVPYNQVAESFCPRSVSKTRIPRIGCVACLKCQPFDMKKEKTNTGPYNCSYP